MPTPKILLPILLLLLTLPTSPTPEFASYYMDFTFPSPYLIPSTSPQFCTYPYPTGYDSSYNYALALAGFSINVKQIIAFDVLIYGKAPTYINISLETNIDVTLYHIRYFMLMTEPSAGHFSLTSNPLNINMNTFAAPLFQTVNVTVPLDITNLSQFVFFTYLVSYQAQSQLGQSIKVELNVAAYHPPHLVQIQITKNSVNRKISKVRYTLVVVHYQYLVDQNIHYRIDQFSLYTSPPSGIDYLLTQIQTNFNIPTFFQTGASNNFEGVCLIGFTHLDMAGDSGQFYQRQMLFNSQTNPMDNSTYFPPLNFAGGFTHAQLFNGNYRVFCVKQCPAGTFFNSSSSSCNACQSPCSTCIFLSTCTSCIPDHHLIGTSCLSCATAQPNCLTCTYSMANNSMHCLSCATGYIVAVDNTCTTCALAISGCLTCSNYSYCQNCVNNSVYFDAGAGSCVSCSSSWVYCKQCTNFKCTLCEKGFYTTNQGCICAVGNLVAGVCTEVAGCVSADSGASSNANCLACDPTYYNPIPLNGVCQCLNGLSIVNGVCNTVENCIAPVLTNGTLVCLFCDIIKKFAGKPDSNGQCVCQDKYEVKEGTCQDICGDGFVMNSTVGFCDDGNTIAGDGCSQSCQEEKDFRCENGSNTSPSQCVYQGIPLILTVDTVIHNQGLNSGVLSFAISPPLLTIRNMDLSQYYTLSCDSTYSVSDVSYDSTKGVLSLTVDYEEDLQGRECNLTLSFDSSIINSQPALITFNVESDDIPLLYINNLSTYKNFIFIFKILSYIALAVFFLSFSHKLIGVQLIHCCQMAFLSFCFYPKNTSMLFSSLKALNWVSGGWQFLSVDSDRTLMTPFTERTGLSPYFIENSFIPIGLILVTIICIVIFFLYRKCTDEITIRRKNTVQAPFIDKAISYTYRWVLFPTSAGFFVPLFLSAYLNNFLIETGRDNIFPQVVNSLAMMFVWTVVGACFMIQCRSCEEDDDENSGQRGVKKWYIPYFLAKLIIFLIIIQIGIVYSLTVTVFPLIILQFISFLLTIFLRPYQSVLHTLGSLMCSMVTIYALTLAILHQFMEFTEDYQILLIFGLEAFIVLAILMSIVRLLLQLKIYIASRKSYSIQKKDEQEMNEKIPKEKGNDERYIQKPSKTKRSKAKRFQNYINKQKKVKEQKDEVDEELKIIQNRLRENFIEYKKERHLPFS